MNKIPTIFERDWNGDRSRVTEQVHPGCEWVLGGEGITTRKYDGTCVMFDGTAWFARRELRRGQPPPDGYRGESFDEETGKTIGWQPVEQSPFAKFFREAVNRPGAIAGEGTYELIGPKVQGNPEGVPGHWLVKHANATIYTVDRTFNDIKNALVEKDWEGFVFHHEDGRMAKIKARDFGLHRAA